LTGVSLRDRVEIDEPAVPLLAREARISGEDFTRDAIGRKRFDVDPAGCEPIDSDPVVWGVVALRRAAARSLRGSADTVID
jgi:hypothetical protein